MEDTKIKTGDFVKRKNKPENAPKDERIYRIGRLRDKVDGEQYANFYTVQIVNGKKKRINGWTSLEIMEKVEKPENWIGW